MNWKHLLIAGAAVAVVFLSRGQSASLSTDQAREQLRAGALLVDVRTVAEFAEKNLPGAINIPLDSLKSGITNHVTDKSQAVLLHCRTGRRSGIAEKELRSLGYTNVLNLGSFEQAQKVVSPANR